MDYLISLLLVLPCVRASAYQSATGHGGRASSHQNASPLRFASVYPSAASPLGLASVYPSAANHLGLASVYPSGASHLGLSSVYPSGASHLGLASVYPSTSSHLGLASVYPSAANHLGFGRLVQLRGNAHQVYASDSSGEEYEPYAMAALPLHPPVPILQVLSPSAYHAPKSKPRRPAKRPRPQPADLYALDTPQVEQAYESAEYEHVYASSEESQPKYSKARDQYEDAESTIVVYARPNRHGGFSYRKPPAPARASTAATAAPARAKEPQEPVIIRIHKYKVIH